MTDLKTLFDKRDEQFSKETIKIFEKINTTLGCVTAYLSDVNEAVAQGIISWEDTTIMDDTIIIIGMVDYEIGSTIALAGMDFTISEENIDEFQSVIHMQVPFKLADEGDEDKLMDYLYEFGEGKNMDEFQSLISPTKIPVLEHEFDLSELSEEQRQSLKLSNPKGGH